MAREKTVYNQRFDRQRLSFATCRKCQKTVAVFGMEGQDVGLVLLENGFRLADGAGLYNGRDGADFRSVTDARERIKILKGW